MWCPCWPRTSPSTRFSPPSSKRWGAPTIISIRMSVCCRNLSWEDRWVAAVLVPKRRTTKLVRRRAEKIVLSQKIKDHRSRQHRDRSKFFPRGRKKFLKSRPQRSRHSPVLLCARPRSVTLSLPARTSSSSHSSNGRGLRLRLPRNPTSDPPSPRTSPAQLPAPRSATCSVR